MKWYKIRIGVFISLILFLLVAILLLFGDFTYYNKKILWTDKELRRARANVEWFKEQTGRLPISLAEIKEYAEDNPETGQNVYSVLRNRLCTEFYSDIKGNSKEYDVLNGKSGWYYNNTTGEVRINLTRPVKFYLKFYFGEKRNQVPADW